MAGDTTSDTFVPSAHSWTNIFLPRSSIATSFFIVKILVSSRVTKRACTCRQMDIGLAAWMRKKRVIIVRATGGIMEKPHWEGKEYSFFSHKNCEYFPSHKGADEENFNCLFCYCPLYALGKKCGGNFRYTEKGIKDCTNCQLPHKRQNYGYVTGKYQELAELMKRMEK